MLLLDELHTVVKKVESLLNQRPLTYVYDQADTVVLRPIDLIRPVHNEDSHVYVAESSDEDDEYKPNKTNYDKLVRLWKRSANLLNQFWRVFIREYLMCLRERHQNVHKQGYTTEIEPKPGQVVLVKDDVIPRGLWKCERITKSHYSRDGEVRSVQVKNAKGNYLTRPLSLLYPLEIDAPPESGTQDEVGTSPDAEPDTRDGHGSQQGEPDQDSQVNDFSEDSVEEARHDNTVAPRSNGRYDLRPRPKKRVAYTYYVATLMAWAQLFALGGAATVTTPQTATVTTAMRSPTYRYLGANPWDTHSAGRYARARVGLRTESMQTAPTTAVLPPFESHDTLIR
ncbi:Integrase core domain containing protein [Aphelenchoides avenae]|nr:Integrase core domain containing protein [Aphelenchus avenae]